MSTVLIVDDSDVVAGMLTQVLETEGFEVHRASNGVEGIEQAYTLIPDVIVMDVEMPLMQGYQASRLLKSRRGVRDIPIIMHTSLSEDRDKYWALSSGADAYATKDFDNLEHLLEQITRLADHPAYDRNTIVEDGKSITRDKIFEIIGLTMDQHLFQSAIYNQLGDIAKDSLGSLSVTIGKILELLRRVCETHIAVLIVEMRKNAAAYIYPDEKIYAHDVRNFMTVCLNDFHSQFPHINLEQVSETVFALEGRTDWEKLRLDNKKISSYTYYPLIGKGGTVVGTLHLGNLSNNYYSDVISRNIELFAESAGLVIENSLLFREVTEMKNKIQHVFAKFVPEEIISDLIEKQSDADLMVGEKRNIVVLFSDIRSFTTISETNSPEAVVGFLNRYFDTQVAIIEKLGGNVDKFIGDAIFAIFGAPISYENNAERAAEAAIQMIRALDTVDVTGLNIPGEKLMIGIGLHEGDAIVGNIGSSTKFDYTAIGDTVNLAARLEGLTKHYKRPVLLSEEVRVKVQDKYSIREVDYVKVKGKDIATSLYAVEFEESIANEQYLREYYKALKLYKMGNFSMAADYFGRLADSGTDDNIVAMFLDRSKEFANDPPERWDGSIALDFK